MESLDILYRLFHEDLHPLTNQQTREYYHTTIENLVQDGGQKILTSSKEDIRSVRFQFYKLLLSDTQKKIQRELHQRVFLNYSEKEQIKSIVQNYQGLVLNYGQIIENNYLSRENELSKFHISPDMNDSDIFKLIYQTLDNILDYLEQIFYEYLDYSLPVSHQQKLWFIYKNKRLADIIITKLHKTDISKEFCEMIIAPLLRIRNNELPILSYENKAYLITYLKVFKKLLTKTPKPSFETICKVLISLEFNTFNIFFFIENHFRSQLENLNSRNELLQLYLLKRNVVTISITSTQRYNSNLPSLKEQLLIWLDEEIKLLKTNLKFSSDTEEENLKSSINQEKKMIELTVSELSLIARLMYESDILKGSKKNFFHFLSDSFKTKKSNTISVESLSNRYYSINKATFRSVDGILRIMLYKLENLKRKT
ncbi:hypothetical protein [Aquimarina sp. SS2-1]|uniref:hypothetical protein n=1 Tax=Aquimarina besae TaxID=3342247 RepID=UPI00366E97D9